MKEMLLNNHLFMAIDVNTIQTAINVGEKATKIAGQAETVGKTFTDLISTWPLMASGLALVIIAVVFWFVLKKIMMNTILGLSLLGAIYFAFPAIFAKLAPHLIPTLIVTMIFGAGGIGAMLLFVWLGII